MNSYATISFVSVLAIVMCNCYSGVSTSNNDTTDIPFGGECEPNKSNCRECYILLKESLLKRDENVRKLSETFFPPRHNLPEFVEITYIFGGDANNKQVWFWTHESSYLFFPMETFQYLSLFFGKPAAFFSGKVNLTLDAECFNARHDIMILLTQRVSLVHVLIYLSV